MSSKVNEVHDRINYTVRFTLQLHSSTLRQLRKGMFWCKEIPYMRPSQSAPFQTKYLLKTQNVKDINTCIISIPFPHNSWMESIYCTLPDKLSAQHHLHNTSFGFQWNSAHAAEWGHMNMVPVKMVLCSRKKDHDWHNVQYLCAWLWGCADFCVNPDMTKCCWYRWAWTRVKSWHWEDSSPLWQLSGSTRTHGLCYDIWPFLLWNVTISHLTHLNPNRPKITPYAPNMQA